MEILLENGAPIRGDLIQLAVIRSDMAPVPLTLEAEIQTDTDLSARLAEGKTVKAGRGLDTFRIIKSVKATDRTTQGPRPRGAIKIIALLDACCPASFVRQRAISKENATLAQIYRAAGCSLTAIDADFQIPRFTCLVGDVPTFHIARALQEQGGIVRWKAGKLRFFRVQDLFQQKPITEVADGAGEIKNSGFMERHQVPFFVSLDAEGQVILGDNDKTRRFAFAPHTDPLRLRNMTRVLVYRRVAKLALSGQLAAGDLVTVAGKGLQLVIVTAAHVFSGENQYTRLWLANVG